MYKNLYVSEDSNVKKINFDLRNKVSQRITRNGSDIHIDYRRTTVGQKDVSMPALAVEFDPDEYQMNIRNVAPGDGTTAIKVVSSA